MGYTALTIIGSDLAADAAADMIAVIVKSLKKSLKEKGSEFNTNGTVNVAMIFHEFITPNHNFAKLADEKLYKLAETVHARLEKIIEASQRAEWDEGDNKRYHISRYKNFLASLKKYMETVKAYEKF